MVSSLVSGCFDLLLDAEKCRYGIEIANTIGSSILGGSGMFFGAVSTPSMSPPMTPWQNCGTPRYFSPSGQSKSIFFIFNCRLFMISEIKLNYTLFISCSHLQ